VLSYRQSEGERAVAGQITAYVGVTDRDWCESLRAIAGLDEANFW
jgi:putative restriction endonuclease